MFYDVVILGKKTALSGYWLLGCGCALNSATNASLAEDLTRAVRFVHAELKLPIALRTHAILLSGFAKSQQISTAKLARDTNSLHSRILVALASGVPVVKPVPQNDPAARITRRSNAPESLDELDYCLPGDDEVGPFTRADYTDQLLGDSRFDEPQAGEEAAGVLVELATPSRFHDPTMMHEVGADSGYSVGPCAFGGSSDSGGSDTAAAAPSGAQLPNQPSQYAHGMGSAQVEEFFLSPPRALNLGDDRSAALVSGASGHASASLPASGFASSVEGGALSQSAQGPITTAADARDAEVLSDAADYDVDAGSDSPQRIVAPEREETIRQPKASPPRSRSNILAALAPTTQPRKGRRRAIERRMKIDRKTQLPQQRLTQANTGHLVHQELAPRPPPTHVTTMDGFFTVPAHTLPFARPAAQDLMARSVRRLLPAVAATGMQASEPADVAGAGADAGDYSPAGGGSPDQPEVSGYADAGAFDAPSPSRSPEEAERLRADLRFSGFDTGDLPALEGGEPGASGGSELLRRRFSSMGVSASGAEAEGLQPELTYEYEAQAFEPMSDYDDDDGDFGAGAPPSSSAEEAAPTLEPRQIIEKLIRELLGLLAEQPAAPRVSLTDTLNRSSRHKAASLFFAALVAASEDTLTIEQTAPYHDLYLSR